ncbi:hypothetical protein HYFRA_00005387 [Hymenoscyphus fraxineus]|uniref:Uncharacterized protein n=1 Tax=Hymenoscyphus fraxineus TaxID=746836 RepID=A0A9N9Q217_9HELO|nr:hypothetical protein HYFRA_00005387 [Hymenoscyphus fraxineus]
MSTANTDHVEEIYAFPQQTFIENIHVRSNGSLLLSTLNTGKLYSLDPNAAKPAPVVVATLPGSTGLTGIATIGPDLYAISGGLHSEFIFANDSMAIYVVSLPPTIASTNNNAEHAQVAVIVDQIPVNNTLMMNGLTSLPQNPHILLSADSIGGRILRINTQTRGVDVSFSDAALGPGGSTTVPLGANGLHTSSSGDYLYFSNSGQGTFARVKINAEGDKEGPIEIIARLTGEISLLNAYDDFALDDAGNAYVSVHSTSLQKITAAGVQTTVATQLKDPTAAAMSGDGEYVYVSTGGGIIDGVTYGGQVLRVKADALTELSEALLNQNKPQTILLLLDYLSIITNHNTPIMKLIVAGSTGFVGTEVIRQALSNPAITSIAALARRKTEIPKNVAPNADASKLTSVICDDFENYSENVKKELSGADACIWLIAVTPSQLKTMTADQARKICLDYTVNGVETITKLPRSDPTNTTNTTNTPNNPFRFIYCSGSNSEQDPNKKPWVLGDYCLMRGLVESKVLKFAKESNGTVIAAVAKSGLIDAPGKTGAVMKVVQTIGRTIIGLPKVDISEISATLLKQAVEGIDKEILLNEDLVRIGRGVLDT